MVPCGTMVIKENSNLFLQLLSFNPNHARIYILLYSISVKSDFLFFLITENGSA